MTPFLESVVAGLVGIFIGWAAKIWIANRKLRSPFARLTRAGGSVKTVIVVPHRKLAPLEGKFYDPWRLHVAFEDMLAVNYAERTLILSGSSDEDIEVLSVLRFQSSHKQENLILICSPKASPITGEALDELNRRVDRFGISFVKACEKPEELELHYQGAVFKSESYRQTDALLADDIRPEEGELGDFGLIVRVKNPWNRHKNLIILAGIRGIGTWGAAKYLRESANILARKSKGEDFACVVRVTYLNHKIVKLECGDHFSTF